MKIYRWMDRPEAAHRLKQRRLRKQNCELQESHIKRLNAMGMNTEVVCHQADSDGKFAVLYTMRMPQER